MKKRTSLLEEGVGNLIRELTRVLDLNEQFYLRDFTNKIKVSPMVGPALEKRGLIEATGTSKGKGRAKQYLFTIPMWRRSNRDIEDFIKWIVQDIRDAKSELYQKSKKVKVKKNPIKPVKKPKVEREAKSSYITLDTLLNLTNILSFEGIEVKMGGARIFQVASILFNKDKDHLIVECFNKEEVKVAEISYALKTVYQLNKIEKENPVFEII